MLPLPRIPAKKAFVIAADLSLFIYFPVFQLDFVRICAFYLVEIILFIYGECLTVDDVFAFISPHSSNPLISLSISPSALPRTK